MLKTTLAILLTLVSLNVSSQEKKDISWIENNLSILIQIEGETPKTFSILQRMEEYKIPGVSIAIVKDGELAYAKGFGIAKSDTGTEVNTHTLFQAASLSKPFSTLAVLKMVEEGLLDLDTDVNTYLTSWEIPENKFTQVKKVTLRRILSHTAGINVHGFPGYSTTDKFPSTTDVLNGYGNTPAIIVDTFPGSIHRYSGGAFTIMQLIVKDVSGMDLSEFMEKKIFPEIGMNESTFQQPLNGDKIALASGAHDYQGKLYEGGWHNYPEIAAAGLWTTPSDIAKFCIHIQNILNGKIEGVLKKEMVEQMLTRQINNVGLGFGLKNEGDSLIFGHDGVNAGFNALMLAFAYKGDAIIIMSNGDNGNTLIDELLTVVSTFYNWNIKRYKTVKTISYNKKELLKFAGKYTYETNGKTSYVKAKIKEGQITLYVPKRPPIRLLPITDLEFIDPEDKIFYNFALNEKGEVINFTWNKKSTLVKVD
jgi:CubicO group peptidase (beta-lactamase class C family)